ncbi:MAG: glycosyltransferase [Clostridia bacterium]|nr:glycosyltransferase [Clostridia bacterium]
MEKLISVIVPVYNTEAYLEKCIKSITEQTYKNLEIILIDDESTDRCPQICDSWGKRDARIKVIHKKNAGPSAARNDALAIAKGEYIGFVDSDDWIEPDLYESVMHIFNTHNPDIVAFDGNRINDNGEIYATTDSLVEGVLTADEGVTQLLKGNISNYLWNKVYKRKIIADARLPEGRLWEDMALLYQIFFIAKKIYCYPKQLYFYYTRSGSLSKDINPITLGHIFLARYERHNLVKKRLPVEAKKYSLVPTALSARRLFDASLWAEVDFETLGRAKEFLKENKTTILKSVKDKRYWVYYHLPRLYSLGRVFVHKLGKIKKGKL